MEPNKYQHFSRTYGSRSHSNLIPGLILVGVGALFFLNNLHIIAIREWLTFWPVVLIAIGGVKLLDSNFTSGRVTGGVMLGAGSLLLAQSLGFLQIRIRDMWPLILIGVGLMMLFQRVGQWDAKVEAKSFRSGLTDQSGSAANTVNIDSVFGGAKRTVGSQDFQGGEINTVFGGVELDLRNAGMAGESLVLECNAIFGGIEIQIPTTWSAVVEGTGIFGAFADETRQPDPASPGIKRLIVKGAAIFGGVEVRN